MSPIVISLAAQSTEIDPSSVDAGLSTGTLTVFLFAAAALGVALLCALTRLMMGPKLPDRVVALDLMGNFAVALICVFAVVFDTPALLNVGVVMALVLFLGTVAFAVYLDRRVQGVWSNQR